MRAGRRPSGAASSSTRLSRTRPTGRSRSAAPSASASSPPGRRLLQPPSHPLSLWPIPDLGRLGSHGRLPHATPLRCTSPPLPPRGPLPPPLRTSASPSLRPSQAVARLGLLDHAVDALQLVAPAGTVAAATFGGVSLWARGGGGGGAGAASGGEGEYVPEHASEYVPLPPRDLAAARGGAAASLQCDGWARSLVASPDGAWLAAWVVVAGLDATASSKLWLWRCADGSPSPTRPRPSDVRHVSATCPPRVRHVSAMCHVPRRRL